MNPTLFQDVSRDLWKISVGHLAQTQLDPLTLAPGILRDRWHSQLFEGRVEFPVRQKTKPCNHLADQCAKR